MNVKISNQELGLVFKKIDEEKVNVGKVITSLIGIEGIKFDLGTISVNEYYFDVDNKIMGNILIDGDYYRVNGSNNKGYQFNSCYFVNDGKVIKVGTEIGADKKLNQVKK